jgi:predicted nuclease of predicted toxin-antitoxin system
VKLLFDENVSARRIDLLADEFPGSAHVDTVDLRGKSDEDVWSCACSGGFIIASKDRDFVEMSFLRGHPPKVILLRIGNAGTVSTAALLRKYVAVIERFVADPDSSLLELAEG